MLSIFEMEERNELPSHETKPGFYRLSKCVRLSVRRIACTYSLDRGLDKGNDVLQRVE